MDKDLGEGITLGEYTYGVLRLIDYGKSVFDFRRYKTLNSVITDDLGSDLEGFFSKLVFKEPAVVISRKTLARQLRI